MSHLTITGAHVGGVQPRLEINNFVSNDKYFSLYVQAWQKMQDDPQTNLQSWFEVGGIHGLPYVSWNGAGSSSQSNLWEGYCTHGSNLFPTWHRPYVALVEQILSGYAQQIASTYTVNKAAWTQAAQEFRFPYWDWAQNTVPPPEVISLDQVNITAPNGARKLVSNPLRRYKFHPIEPTFFAPFSRYPTTLRWPTTQTKSAKEDIASMRSGLQDAQSSTTIATFNMLTRIKDWDNFSNHDNNGGSLESIHDGIHVMVGGDFGHMSYPDVAAFDPIFFLHHCNVDRMVSLWSAINLGAWMSPGDSGTGTWALPPFTPVDTNTPLSPFWINQTSFWKSSATTNSASLGYTYPEFVGLTASSPAALQTAILNKVTTLYGGAALQSLTSLNKAKATATTQTQLREWSAQLSFDNQEAGGSLSILFFLGDVPADSSQWLRDSRKIGSAHAFVSNHAGGRKNGPLQRGTVLLNNGIAQFSGLSSFDPSVVSPYLKQNLHWRVLKVDGTPVELQSLNVTVVEVPVSMPSTGSGVPVAGTPIEHGDITSGRSG